MPVFCWIVSFGKLSPPVPEYQSGAWTDWVGLCFEGQVAWPLFPLIGGSMGAMVLLLIHREHFSRFLMVRVAVYAGLLVGLVFAVLLPVALQGAAFLSLVPDGAALVIAGVAVGLWVAIRGAGAAVALSFGWILFAAALLAVFLPSGRAGMVVGFFGCLGGWPLAMGLAFGCMSFWLWRHPQMESTRVGAMATICVWIGGYAAGWVAVAKNAVDMYAMLPTFPPGKCYIATAAARGHRGFVGAEAVVMGDGSVLLVNRQLRVLKCGEVVLRALWPRVHGVCRGVYDVVGPHLAARLTFHWMADAAYAGLKPAEWITRLGLRMLGVDAERMYRR